MRARARVRVVVVVRVRARGPAWKAGEPRLFEHVSASVYLSSSSETPKSEIFRMPSTLTWLG